ncbi:MAG: PEP-CTERM sorting domain-containing protein [Fimbriimonadaceae bacterium]
MDALDGRWAFYSTATATKTVDIFGDNDGDSGAGQISQLAFYDTTLSAAEISALGGAGSPVPEPATLSALALGVGAILRRRSLRGRK